MVLNGEEEVTCSIFSLCSCAADHTHNTTQFTKGISLASMSQKRKLSSYSLAQKYDVLMLLQRGEKASKISRDLNIPKNNISTWAKRENKEKIIKEFETGNFTSERKRLREASMMTLNKLCYSGLGK